MGQMTFYVKTYNETESFKILRARCRKKLNFNSFPNKSQSYKLVKNFEAHGICEDHKVMGSSLSGPYDNNLNTQEYYQGSRISPSESILIFATKEQIKLESQYLLQHSD